MTRKRILRITLGSVALICLGWTAWWFNASWTALNGAQSWIEEQRAAGTRIVFGRMTTGGFPFNISLDIDRIAIAAPLSNWRLNADRIIATTRAWNFNEIVLEAEGPVDFGLRALPGIDDLSGSIHGLNGLYAVVPTGDRTRVLVAADRVETEQGPGSGEVAIDALIRNGSVAGHEETIADLRAEVVALSLPGLVAPGLSDEVTAALISLTVSGPTPNPENSLQRQLNDWRESGGVIEVTEMAIAWDTLNAQGDGTVTLDPSMRPLAAFSFRLNGLSETADRFADAGLIDRDVAEYIGVGSNILSLGSSDPGTVELPISIQSGRVYLGPFEVAEVDPILPGMAPVDDTPIIPDTSIDTLNLPPPPEVSEETLNAHQPE